MTACRDMPLDGPFAIRRLDAGTAYSEFRKWCVVPEEPCIISGLSADRPPTRMQVEPAGAFDAWLPSDPAFTGLQPRLLAEYLDAELHSLRNSWGRVFRGVEEQVTPFHFDGNCLDVFNRQLLGTKRWTLVDPKTPLPLRPGSNVSLPGPVDLRGIRHTQFVLNPGELVYVPRLWMHHVLCISAESLSVSWVATRLNVPTQFHPVFERSLRYTDLFLRLRRLFPRLRMPNACLFNSVHEQDDEPLVHLVSGSFSLPKSVRFAAQEAWAWLRYRWGMRALK